MRDETSSQDGQLPPPRRFPGGVKPELICPGPFILAIAAARAANPKSHDLRRQPMRAIASGVAKSCLDDKRCREDYGGACRQSEQYPKHRPLRPCRRHTVLSCYHTEVRR